MKKRDLVMAAFISEIDALLIMWLCSVLNACGSFDWLVSILWLIGPLMGLLGIYIADWLGSFSESLWQASKTILVGSLNILIETSLITIAQKILWTPDFVKEHYPVVISIIFLIAATNSYFWNKFWSFEKRDTEDKIKEAGKFYTITITGYILSVLISSTIAQRVTPMFGCTTAGWNLAANVIAAVIVFVYHFMGYKFIVFKK